MKRSLRAALVMIFLTATFAALPSSAQADESCAGVVRSESCKHGLPAWEYDALLPQMLAHSPKSLPRVGVDSAELRRYSLYQLPRRDVTFYDAPNGNPMDKVDPGYAFTGVREQRDGWVRVDGDRWLPADQLSGTRASGFSGVLLNGYPPFPLLWMARSVHAAEVPGGKMLQRLPVLAKHTPYYIFKTVRVGNWDWYLIGDGLWVEQRNVAVLKPVEAKHSGRWIAVDLYEQIAVALEGGTPRFATLISSGLAKNPTREGMFAVWAKLRSGSMSGFEGKPEQYNIPVVPYILYFDGSIGLHGTFWHNGFGYRHSRGCVNLSISDAKWLYNFADVGTPVYVWRSR